MVSCHKYYMPRKYLIFTPAGTNLRSPDPRLDDDVDIQLPGVRDDHGLHWISVPGEAGLPQLPCLL